MGREERREKRRKLKGENREISPGLHSVCWPQCLLMCRDAKGRQRAWWWPPLPLMGKTSLVDWVCHQLTAGQSTIHSYLKEVLEKEKKPPNNRQIITIRDSILASLQYHHDPQLVLGPGALRSRTPTAPPVPAWSGASPRPPQTRAWHCLFSLPLVGPPHSKSSL